MHLKSRLLTTILALTIPFAAEAQVRYTISGDWSFNHPSIGGIVRIEAEFLLDDYINSQGWVPFTSCSVTTPYAPENPGVFTCGGGPAGNNFFSYINYPVEHDPDNPILGYNSLEALFSFQSPEMSEPYSYAHFGWFFEPGTFLTDGVYLSDELSPKVGRGTLTVEWVGPSTTVPEPSTWLLLAAGLGVLAPMAKRARQGS